MKTFFFAFSYLILSAIVLPSIGQTAYPVIVRNTSPTCDLTYTVMCTDNECGSVFAGSSGVILANGGTAIITSTHCSGDDFAGLRFRYFDGDNVSRYITFNHQLDNECAGIEGCNALYPWFHQGIEIDCLLEGGEIRADYFSEVDDYVIFFKNGNL